MQPEIDVSWWHFVHMKPRIQHIQRTNNTKTKSSSTAKFNLQKQYQNQEGCNCEMIFSMTEWCYSSSAATQHTVEVDRVGKTRLTQNLRYKIFIISITYNQIKDVWQSGWVWVDECFFWHWSTRVVLDKGPLNGSVCVHTTHGHMS